MIFMSYIEQCMLLHCHFLWSYSVCVCSVYVMCLYVCVVCEVLCVCM